MRTSLRAQQKQNKKVLNLSESSKCIFYSLLPDPEVQYVNLCILYIELIYIPVLVSVLSWCLYKVY